MRNCFWWTALLLVAYSRTVGAPYSLMDAFQMAINLSLDVRKHFDDLLPTRTSLLELGKQLVAAYPFEILSNSINKMCSSAMAVKLISPKVMPDINLMHFQLRTPCKNYSYPLLKAEEMWKSPEFDPKKKVVILATGWTTTINDVAIEKLAKAYNCRSDVNFVAMDVSSFVDTLYTWSALNTQGIGRHIAKGLVHLSAVVPVENIHLIGHSLGAHIMGAAGRHFNALINETISRITGLDPAKPCFNEGEDLSGLMRGDAKFIDVIHSNPGVLGKRDPLGDVDFYPGGWDPLPNGCMSIICAHSRAWEYYAESVYPGNENNFLSKRCSSRRSLLADMCRGAESPMGFAVSPYLKGNYFLEVNSSTPFGLNASKNSFEANKNCGLCSHDSVSTIKTG